MRHVSILAAVTMSLAMAARAGAIAEPHFELRSGADLVTLCDTGLDDPLRREAVQMCQGFAVGVYRTLIAVTARDRAPLFCPPVPTPTRNEAIARFVGWAKAHPDHQSEDAVDFLGRYLVQAYPCPKAGADRGRASK